MSAVYADGVGPHLMQLHRASGQPGILGCQPSVHEQRDRGNYTEPEPLHGTLLGSTEILSRVTMTLPVRSRNSGRVLRHRAIEPPDRQDGETQVDVAGLDLEAPQPGQLGRVAVGE